PFDSATLLESTRKTGRLIMADTGWATAGFSAEVLALAAEHAFSDLKCAPRRIALADCPIPSTPAFAHDCYPHAKHIAAAACEMTKSCKVFSPRKMPALLDIPDPSFTGPF